jgi:hypothetical protein
MVEITREMDKRQRPDDFQIRIFFKIDHMLKPSNNWNKGSALAHTPSRALRLYVMQIPHAFKKP